MRKWIQHLNRMPSNRLPGVMKHHSTTGRRNHGRRLKRLLDTWKWNVSTSGPTPWQVHEDDKLCTTHNVRRTSKGWPKFHRKEIRGSGFLLEWQRQEIFSLFIQINLSLQVRVLNFYKIYHSTKIPQTAVLALFVGYFPIMNTFPPFSTTQEYHTFSSHSDTVYLINNKPSLLKYRRR